MADKTFGCSLYNRDFDGNKASYTVHAHSSFSVFNSACSFSVWGGCGLGGVCIQPYQSFWLMLHYHIKENLYWRHNYFVEYVRKSTECHTISVLCCVINNIVPCSLMLSGQPVWCRRVGRLAEGKRQPATKRQHTLN